VLSSQQVVTLLRPKNQLRFVDLISRLPRNRYVTGESGPFAEAVMRPALTPQADRGRAKQLRESVMRWDKERIRIELSASDTKVATGHWLRSRKREVLRSPISTERNDIELR